MAEGSAARRRPRHLSGLRVVLLALAMGAACSACAAAADDPSTVVAQEGARMSSDSTSHHHRADVAGASEGASEAVLDQPFRISVGAAVRVDAAGLTVGFAGVGSDSRCPKDVQCMWEGDAGVLIWVAAEAGERADYELHTSRGDRQIRHGEYVVALEGLDPYPVSTVSIAPEDYEATLKVSR